MSRIVPKKSLGQHFLKDHSVVDRMIKAAHLTSEDVVLEIGPGPGILTHALLQTPIKFLYVVEVDAQFLPALKQLEARYAPRLQVIFKSALDLKIQDLNTSKVKILANLPYNIGTALILNWLKELNYIDSMILMLQKEVVDRLSAVPRTKAYGSLSLWCQVHCKISKLFEIGPQAFYPPPKVDSAIIQLDPLRDLVPQEDLNKLEKLLAILFQQRRKMLRGILKKFSARPIEDVLEGLEISPQSRPEELSLEMMLKLAKDHWLALKC